MTAPHEDLTKTIQLLAGINRLSLKAFKTQTAQSLVFLILNDTVPIAFYDRAVLWKFVEGKPKKLLGVSGQEIIKQTDLSKQWQEVINGIKEPEKVQIITSPNIPASTSLLWMPILSREKPVLGLWLERWNDVAWKEEEINVLGFLLQGYGVAWERFERRISLQTIVKKPIPILLFILALALAFIQVPLRIVAPCEVVPEDPVVITAPLEGIINKIDVKPGDMVHKGTVLFEYDKRVPLQELRIAQKKVEIMKSEVDRSNSLSYKDKRMLAELAINTLKLKKEQLDLDLAEYHANLLDVEAPASGVVMMDAPEEWRGKPVRVGEKVMILGDPSRSKVRMWIPEEDNIPLDMNRPIKVILNIAPESSKQAHLSYISSYTHVSDKQVTSFIAEAHWEKDTQGVRLGLKGTAVLYGEDVSLFYWIIRKPWMYVRRFFGL